MAVAVRVLLTGVRRSGAVVAGVRDSVVVLIRIATLHAGALGANSAGTVVAVLDLAGVVAAVALVVVPVVAGFGRVIPCAVATPGDHRITAALAGLDVGHEDPRVQDVVARVADDDVDGDARRARHRRVTEEARRGAVVLALGLGNHGAPREEGAVDADLVPGLVQGNIAAVHEDTDHVVEGRPDELGILLGADDEAELNAISGAVEVDDQGEHRRVMARHVRDDLVAEGVSKGLQVSASAHVGVGRRGQGGRAVGAEDTVGETQGTVDEGPAGAAGADKIRARHRNTSADSRGREVVSDVAGANRQGRAAQARVAIRAHTVQVSQAGQASTAGCAAPAAAVLGRLAAVGLPVAAGRGRAAGPVDHIAGPGRTVPIVKARRAVGARAARAPAAVDRGLVAVHLPIGAAWGLTDGAVAASALAVAPDETSGAVRTGRAQGAATVRVRLIPVLVAAHAGIPAHAGGSHGEITDPGRAVDVREASQRDATGRAIATATVHVGLVAVLSAVVAVRERQGGPCAHQRHQQQRW